MDLFLASIMYMKRPRNIKIIIIIIIITIIVIIIIIIMLRKRRYTSFAV